MTGAAGRAGPTRGAALAYGLRLGCLSFGGPAGQIGLLHREVVGERAWLDEAEFARALNLCMLLPGPEALQLVIYLGWRWHGLAGGVVAGLAFLGPAAVLLTLLSFVYVLWGTLAPVAAAVAGLQSVVVALVFGALARLGRRALGGTPERLIALAAFAALAFLGAPFLAVVALAAAAGALGLAAPAPPPPVARPARLADSLGVLAVGALLWALPPALLALGAVGARPVELYLRLTKVALGGFGGAYAVLAYVNQELVHGLGGLDGADLLAGLALSETTPGPLVIVLQFYGFVCGWHVPGPLAPAAAALLCSLLAAWATFLPSFVLVLALAPHLDRMLAQPRLGAMLRGVTAAVVGVIGAFALTVATQVLWPAGRPDPVAIGVALVAAAALARPGVALPWVLAGGAGLALALRAAGA